MVTATRLVATGAATTVTVVVAVLVGSSTLVAVMVTVWAVAGAVQVEPDQVPAVEDQVTVPRLPPEAEALKAVLELTVLVEAAGARDPTLTDWGVTTVEVEVEVPAALVTVRVKVRAPVQLAVIGAEATPVAGQVRPWLRVPVPLA